MKKIFIANFLLAAAVCVLLACRPQKPLPAVMVTQTLMAQADSFSTFITDNFLGEVKNKKTGPKKLQSLFLQARLLYKKFEWAAEYFTPAAAKLINGAPIPGVEYDQVIMPQGLQVIESFLFPVYDTAKREALINQLELLPAACTEYTTYFKNIAVLDWQVFDAAKLQVFRLMTLGITGFDAPLAQNSMNETACSLNSLRSIIALYDGDGYTANLFNTATNYLNRNTNFNSFNRATFITAYANPLTRSLDDLQKALHMPAMQYTRLLNQHAATLFDTDAFNVTAFAPGTAYKQTAQQIELGKKLFNDPVLSGNLSRSCASCHNPAKAFTDGLVRNSNITGNGLLPRNTPTLINAALQPALFYDMRAYTLEGQVMDVALSSHEMNGNMNIITAKLWQDKNYRQLFTAAFIIEGRTAIDTTEITHAIAEYVRSLTSLNSRFDTYMRGDVTAMNTQQVHGFNLFMGKAKCGTCHYMPLFNGTLPPMYMNAEPEVIGVPAAGNKVLDADVGRQAIINVPFYSHAFKTPTVRNAARTAPYMHNGVFKTLEEVIDFYNKGGGAGMGLNVPNQTLPGDSLNLSAAEITDLVAFIKCLDSE